MARPKARRGPGAGLADDLNARRMARVVPPKAVHEVPNAHGRNSQRIRAFPAVAGVYCVMALRLYPEASCEAVFSAVAPGRAWKAGAAPPAEVGKVAIRLLRSRIGAQPPADLVQRCREFYDWVLMHHTVRWLLHHGAAWHRIPHEDPFFTRHVQSLR